MISAECMCYDLLNLSLVNTTDRICGECDFGGNNTLNDTFVPGVPLPAWFQAITYIMYCTIFVVALCGNGIVCYIVYSSTRMRTVTNYFIVNLAVGDILMTCFCVPFSFVSTLVLQHWPFGTEMCHLVSYSQAISVFVSAYTLVAISFDRYIAIIYPLKPRMTRLQAKIVIFIVWLVAILTALPIPIVSQVNQPTAWHIDNDKYICRENWESKKQQYYYSMALMILQYFFPLSVLVFTYSRIAVVVWGKKVPGEAEDTRDQRLAKSKRKMIKMMLTVVIVFTICWLPFNTLLVVGDQYPGIWDWRGIVYMWAFSHWLAMSHTCYNPVIYCWMNAKFRNGFCLVLSQVPCFRVCVKKWKNGAEDLQRANTYSTYASVRTMSTRSKGSTRTTCMKFQNEMLVFKSNNHHKALNHLEEEQTSEDHL